MFDFFDSGGTNTEFYRLNGLLLARNYCIHCNKVQISLIPQSV
jgi:hypothetical protein